MWKRGATLAPIRLANAAAQLPYGSGKTKGEASPPCSTPLPPLRGLYTILVCVLVRVPLAYHAYQDFGHHGSGLTQVHLYPR